MPRLIDADRLIEWIQDLSWKGRILTVPDIRFICNELAKDTNVPGKWIRLTGMAPPEYHGHKICSVCESFAPYDPLHPWREMLSPYCPGCGATMEVQNAAD